MPQCSQHTLLCWRDGRCLHLLHHSQQPCTPCPHHHRMAAPPTPPLPTSEEYRAQSQTRDWMRFSAFMPLKPGCAHSGRLLISTSDSPAGGRWMRGEHSAGQLKQGL